MTIKRLRTGDRINRIKVFWITLCVTIALLVLAPMLVAYQDGGPEPITANPLSDRTQLTDNVSFDIRLQPEGRPEQVLELDDPSRITVVEFTIQPGAIFPWHTHPGPALAGVQQGELIYIYADDCIERPYPTGTMFIDPGGDNVHSAFNPSETEETIVIATILNAPNEGGLTLPVDEAENQRLDQKCGIQR
ncbi:cupin domain-containing protein [Nodosilinea sp. P-1105]|uniref:cupin domain-containing protein n=1 Tax=Nodosilinea sp. P-1105 TaxID=2546229 RepID=UPI00146AF9A7|nr:cupin domain-containing protein [Nodosilinea sp. P-1105]NMF86549.1 cupin domain-containing protein [Nodosilinea sp. P-1105]